MVGSRRVAYRAIAAAALALLGCGGDGSETASDATTGAGAGGPVGSTLTMSGTVIDFETEQAIASSATVTVSGLSPAPSISVTGPSFEIRGIAPHSVFHVLSGAPPTHRSTYNVASEVLYADVTGVSAAVVAETYLTALEAMIQAPPPGTGMVIARAVDGAHAPRAGVAASAILVNGAPPSPAPLVLDVGKAPDPMASATSASGYLVYAGVPEGLVSFTAASGSNVTVVASQSPVAATAVTLVELVVSDGAQTVPTNVSFSTQVVPIFTKRGCINCHSGNDIGADLGDLALNGSANKIHGELTQEISPTHAKTRVDLQAPESSLLLRMPSFEAPPDAHPNVTFASPADADYLVLLGWIREGALQN